MITPEEYRRMAQECFSWAREAQTDGVRLCYVNLAQTWLEAASWVERISRHSAQPPSPLMDRPHPKRKAA